MAIRMGQHRRRASRQPVQLPLRPRRRRTWGGPRDGAGRPSLGGVPHTARPALASRFPVHVTLKVDDQLPNLRTKPIIGLVEACLRAGKERSDFRLVHYSVQAHHLHLIVEARGASALCSGVKGLSVRIARRLNSHLGRKGQVFAERYFSRILTSPRQVRNCLCYVLLNTRRHDAQRGRTRERGWIDPCSSGRFFDGWRNVELLPQTGVERSVSPPHTWLLSTGWRLRGLIGVDEVVGPS